MASLGSFSGHMTETGLSYGAKDELLSLAGSRCPGVSVQSQSSLQVHLPGKGER